MRIVIVLTAAIIFEMVPNASAGTAKEAGEIGLSFVTPMWLFKSPGASFPGGRGRW